MEHDFLSNIKRKVILFDGGMGSLLIAAGLGEGEAPESWNLTRPEDVTAVHEAYLEAGAEGIQTNTFGGTGVKLAASPSGRAIDPGETNERAAALAREARDRFGATDRYVAGDIGPTGRFFPPIGDLTEEEAYATFAAQAKALDRGGVDLFLIEMVLSLYCFAEC